MYGLTPFKKSGFDIFNAFNDFEKNFFGGSMPVNTCKTDIRDEGEKYVMEAELPGFTKEDIKLDINGSYLVLTAEHKNEKDEKDLFKFRKNAITLAEKAIGVIVAIVSFTLPLIIGRVTGRFRMSIVHVIIYGVLLLILYAVICHFLNAFLVRKGLYKNSI